MDVFKLTFETTIVGISAFLWIGIAIDLISPNFLARMKALIPELNQSVAAAVLLSCAYCLGSAILPISGQLVNDEHWPLSEDTIRCRVEIDQLRLLQSANANTLPLDSTVCASKFWSDAPNWWRKLSTKARLVLAKDSQVVEEQDTPLQKALMRFQVRETRELGQGAEKQELFKQLRERVTVLRGAFFSAFVSLLICLFGWIAPQCGERCSLVRKTVGVSLASVLTGLALVLACQDFGRSNIFDIPILEAVCAAVTIFGGIVVLKGVRRPSFLRSRLLVVVALCAGLSYGGWIWSEVLYDRQVITSSALTEVKPERPSVQQVRSADSALPASQTPEEEQTLQVH